MILTPQNFSTPPPKKKFSTLSHEISHPPKISQLPPKISQTPRKFRNPPRKFCNPPPPPKISQPPPHENFSTPPPKISQPPPRKFLNPPKISQPPRKFLNPPENFSTPPRNFPNPPRKFLNPSRKFLNPPENISTPLENQPQKFVKEKCCIPTSPIPTSLFFLFLSISFPSLFKKKSENFGGGLNPLNPPPLNTPLPPSIPRLAASLLATCIPKIPKIFKLGPPP